MFSTLQKTNFKLSITFILSSANAFNLDQFKILSFGNGVTPSQTTDLRLFSRLKEFADDTFIFDENGRKFFKRVENTVGKGETARYEQFLPFPQVFQKTCIADMLKQGLLWERV